MGKPKAKIYIDGANMFYAQQKLGFSIDWQKMQNYLKERWDVLEMTTDILLDRAEMDDALLFSGDSDFDYLAKKLHDLGKDVVVFSSRKMISWELKLAAKKYVFLEDIKEQVVRNKNPRAFGAR